MRSVTIRVLIFAWCLILSTTLSAADVLPAVDRRFASESGEEVPSFQRHVVPLLGRLGCNGRACHGSFQGRGGFRLSLFGYDFRADHESLLAGDPPRVDRQNPADSLVLRKPTLLDDHEGGRRFAAGSWQHHLLRRWIAAGAAPAPEDKDAAEFVGLDVRPAELLFDRRGATAKLTVVARWSDGSAEDVTPLCRFRSNDESIATVDATGLVTAAGPGDSAVVAFYDNGVVPVPVLMPLSDRTGPNFPSVATPTRIDELVVAKLRKLGIVPSELCTDAEFLRRASLDITGTLPLPAEIEAFLVDKSPDKRPRKIDELLGRPGYAAWWATRLCDYQGNHERTGPQGGEQSLNGEKARQWYDWVRRRVQDNQPYDRLVAGILLSVGRAAGQSFDDYCVEMSGYFRQENPSDFAARETMPYFWTRRTVGGAQDKALSVAYAFLGVSLQCAQCHKHPFDQWTKQDFDQFAAFFNGVRYGPTDRTRTAEMKRELELTGDEDSGSYKRQFMSLVQSGRIAPFKDLSVPAPSSAKQLAASRKLGRVITPKLLGGDEVLAQSPDPRQPVFDWMRQPDNPYFARAFVNRVWAGYFQVGLIEPTDDLNLANPPSNPELLDELSRQFIERGYDMKWLHRTIARSHTYQRSWQPNETNRLDERNFSRAVPRRLAAEIVADALVLATASPDAQTKLVSDPASQSIGAASGLASPRNTAFDPYVVSLFGKPARAINCDCERSGEASVMQTVYLRNDPQLLAQLDRADGWLKSLAPAKRPRGKPAEPERPHEPDVLIREAFLRTLSRPPTEHERQRAERHFAEGEVFAGLRDLLWALLNTREFLVNH